MIAQASFLKNHAEIKRAENLGIETPEGEYEYDELAFSMKDVSCAHLANTGQIIIYIQGWKWILEYEEDLWKSIKNYLRDK